MTIHVCLAGATGWAGSELARAQVHPIRLPGFVISAEVIFGMPDQKLTIRHDAGSSARPYVDGALLAIRRASSLVGVHRGLPPCWTFKVPQCSFGCAGIFSWSV